MGGEIHIVPITLLVLLVGIFAAGCLFGAMLAAMAKIPKQETPTKGTLAQDPEWTRIVPIPEPKIGLVGGTQTRRSVTYLTDELEADKEARIRGQNNN